MEKIEAQPGLVLRQQMTMHARLQDGSLYCYSILHDEKNIGSWSIRRERRKGKTTVTTTYILGSGDDAKTFSNVEEFKAAYKAQLADAEWDAAQPKR